MTIIPGTHTSQSRFGVDRNTGKLIFGWAHCLQSLTVLVTTAFNTRVMRLDFGSKIPDLVDRPANSTIIMQWYVSIVSAITKWEPGYRVTNLALTKAGPDGGFTFELTGTFYPRGHLGDYTISELKIAPITLYTAR
jgi:phage baseplate assembly protein W